MNIVNSNDHRISTQQINKNRNFSSYSILLHKKYTKINARKNEIQGRWLSKKNANQITHNLLILGDKYIIFWGRIHKICIFYKEL